MSRDIMSTIKVGGITEKDLRRRSYLTAMEEIVRAQVKLIDENIKYVNSNGGSRVQFLLPETIELGTMNKKDSQLVVYTELILIYRDQKGFNVAIEYDGRANLIIAWNGTCIDAEEKRRRLDILKNVNK